jgi:hypothetical protein
MRQPQGGLVWRMDGFSEHRRHPDAKKQMYGYTRDRRWSVVLVILEPLCLGPWGPKFSRMLEGSDRSFYVFSQWTTASLPREHHPPGSSAQNSPRKENENPQIHNPGWSGNVPSIIWLATVAWAAAHVRRSPSVPSPPPGDPEGQRMLFEH